MFNSKFSKIKNFIQNIDPDYKIHKSKEWSSSWTKQELWIPKFYKGYKDIGDIHFKFYLLDEYNIRPNLYIISLLHEIGHLQTETQELSDERAVLYTALDWQYQKGQITEEEYYFKYFNIPAEKLATAWAVEYYQKHENEIEKLLKDLK